MLEVGYSYQTMDREATVWPERPASGGSPKRGPSIFQEFHADVPRDVRWAASKSGAQDHQATNLVQGASGAWHEACPDFVTPCLWEQVCLDEIRLEGPSQHPVTPRPRSLSSHHR